MKKILAPVLPALALLTLGGCASTSYLSTTEDDGMYYSSKDRVTAPAQVASSGPSATPATSEETAAAPGDVANPDYAGTTSGAAANSSGEYYDDDYYYASRLRRFHSPYRGIGMGYYDFAYTDPYWYGGSAFGYSPWSYGYGGFYDPFYSPWGYGGVNISIGFGRPWYRPWGGYAYGYGYSPFDYGWGRPWGGYNYGYYNGYYSGLYGGYYGGGSYYGGNGWGNYYDRPGRRVTYGPRRDRAVDGQRLNTSSPDGVVSGRSRGRVQDGFTNNPTPAPSGVTSQPGGGRRRVQELTETSTPPTSMPMPAESRRRIAQDQSTPGQAGELSTATDPTAPAGGGRRWRVLDNTNNVNVVNPDGSTNQPAPAEYGRRRRADWSNGGNSQPQPDQPRLADQPRRQRLYDQSSQPSQQPSQPSRSYSEPSRSYSQPSRSYEPSRSYSEPSRGGSNSGGSFGGGNSGGGGGGRRGRVQ